MAVDEPHVMFTIVKAASAQAPRLARLALPGRAVIDTPHYLANTSRGVVPHLTQDTLSRSTAIIGLYASLEDCTYNFLALTHCQADMLTTA